MITTSYKKAKRIRAAERDRNLNLNAADWASTPPPGWEQNGKVLARGIGRDEGATQAIPFDIEELILRFPSAPVHGLQRLHENHVKLENSENFHTFRVLRSGREKDVRAPIKRIFLMHTGLNELDRMGLYYRLASRLIEQDHSTVCIVRPFPGHMTRFPFQVFAETPLDKYLWDGSHLFRQFMRFMIETQWFLSTIVRRSSYRCASGADLLGERDETPGSRIDAEVLATEMRRDWLRLRASSVATEEAETPESQPNRTEVGPEADEEQFADAIETLRATLNLERDFPPQGGALADPEKPIEPKLHALGYSLGGFTAQSVFMSWPFLFSSCATVLAGGALRELSPTGFADPEEWQTVLHSLRYELDDRMMSDHLGIEDSHIAGIDRELFTYFKRTFYEVFQQEYKGSIQTRYEAFRERMLFIVGGNDPVVRPESVLQSGPKGGLNLLEIGGLGHFFKDTGGDQAEQHQRTFWLPEMSILIHHFADNAAAEQDEQRRFTWFDETLVEPELDLAEWNEAFPPSGKTEGSGIVRPLSPTESVAIERDGSLEGELFERCLDDLLHRTSSGANGGGILFSLRNELPTVLLPPSAVRESAAALYHDDLSIVRYCHGITARRTALEESIPQICLVLPANSRSIMRGIDSHRAYPSQSESAGGCVAKRLAPEDVWEESLKMCYTLAEHDGAGESVRRYQTNTQLDGEFSGAAHDVIKLAKEFTNHEGIEYIPSLPDCWIWLSRDYVARGQDSRIDVSRGITRLIELTADVGGSAQQVQEEISAGHLRIVSVSRARYNPRFRGRLVVNGSDARKLMIHAALCLELSRPITEFDRDSVFT